MTVNTYFQLTMHDTHGLAMAPLQAMGLFLCFLTLGTKEHPYLRYACVQGRGERRVTPTFS